MIRVSQIKLPVDYTEELLHRRIENIVKTPAFKVNRIVKKSIDARDKNNLLYIMTVDIEAENERLIRKKHAGCSNLASANDIRYVFPFSGKETQGNVTSPIIIGSGPAGYFCGLYLARAGFQPIIIERGKNVEERTIDVDAFWRGEAINPNSNVAFGEGGAGTFSDGKLNTGIRDKEGRIHAVIGDFITFGASSDIDSCNKPHIGTDVLKTVMKNMREEIISHGGKVYFETLFTGYDMQDDGRIHVICKDLRCGMEHRYQTHALILAIGHSARDTFFMLNEKNLAMEAKAFAMGVRIEHKREMINASQYGESSQAKRLPAADYKMTYRSSTGRSVYSFCMCPGGYVVNASSDEEQSVVNGMSYHDRAADNSNSAIVVNVTTEDFINEGFGKYGVLAGVYFQKKYERLAYMAGGGNIPVQLFKDYTEKKVSENFGDIKPCIKGNYTFADLNNCLPEYVNNAIIEGINYYDKRLIGFASEDAVLSGIESRTSSPIRIIRDENYMSNKRGIFPCGEGAGYAGGITSAAVDGIKTAEAAAAYLLKVKDPAASSGASDLKRPKGRGI